MSELVAFLGILLGSVLMLLGFLLIAPQVRVHQIRVKSRGRSVFVAGAALIVLGEIMLLGDDGARELAQIALVMGVAGLPAAMLIGHHESLQARENGQVWRRDVSLMAWILAFASVVTVLGVVLIV